MFKIFWKRTPPLTISNVLKCPLIFNKWKTLSKRDTKTTTNSCLSKIHHHKHVRVVSVFNPPKTTLTFLPLKFLRKKYIKVPSIFYTSKLLWKKYIKVTLVFCLSILFWSKYFETTWNFCPSKLRGKKCRNNLGYLPIEIT